MLGLAFVVREQTFFFSLTPSLPPSLSLSLFLRCLSLPGNHDQLQTTAARLLLLRLDVVVYLELGLVGLLCHSVLQLPDGERDTGS